jgi:hypothetical protein
MNLGCWYEKEDCDGNKRDGATHSILHSECSRAHRMTSIHRGFPPRPPRCRHLCMISRKPPPVKPKSALRGCSTVLPAAQFQEKRRGNRGYGTPGEARSSRICAYTMHATQGRDLHSAMLYGMWEGGIGTHEQTCRF